MTSRSSCREMVPRMARWTCGASRRDLRIRIRPRSRLHAHGIPDSAAGRGEDTAAGQIMAHVTAEPGTPTGASQINHQDRVPVRVVPPGGAGGATGPAARPGDPGCADERRGASADAAGPERRRRPAPRRAATPGERQPGSLARTRRLSDNAGMARDDRWAQVLRAALPILDEARPAGMLEWVPRVAPVVTQAVVGAGHWAAGRRRRALAAWTSAAGYGLVAWGLGTEAPTPAEARQNAQQNFERLQREAVLRRQGTKAPAAARTPEPAARRLERHFSRHLSRYTAFFRATETPLYRLGFTVVGMVLGVWWGLRWLRRLTVLAIAVVAPNVVIEVPWVARAVQRRRPRIAAGWALVAAGSVARLRAAAAEPLR